MRHIALVALSLFVFSCGGETPTPVEPAAQQVKVDVAPKQIRIAPSGTQTFLATVTGTVNTSVSWSADGGSVSPTGVYTAPASAGTYRVTATSIVAPTRSATAIVTVQYLPVTISLSPTNPIGIGCSQVQFTATVSGGNGNTAVTWAIADPPIEGGPALGSINATGLYTLPNPMPYASMTTHISATSVADPTVIATATVTTNTTITGVVITPASTTLVVNGVQSFTGVAKTSCDP